MSSPQQSSHPRPIVTPAHASDVRPSHASPEPSLKVKRSLGRTRLWAWLLVFVLGVFVARLPATLGALGALGSSANFIDPVDDVHTMLSRYYVDQPDEKKLREGAITGMLEALDDPYAEYIPPDDAHEFSKQMTGQFVGIGCQVEIRDGWLTVVSPIEDSPAYLAGIIANDRITTIEGEPTLGKSVDDCIKMLTGEPQTPVKIVVQRDAKDIPFTIIRDRIVSKSVRGFRRLADDTGHWQYLIDPAKRIAYVRLSQFTPTSPDELTDALAAAAGESPDGQIGALILDLRNNPGGFMDAALHIVDMFIDDAVIMSVRGRGQSEARGEVFRAGQVPDQPHYPIAILINANSASASEIVSGSLQDHDRAIVIGERSFGKGLVQTVHPLPHQRGAQVKFTTQRYYLPSGRTIQRTDGSTQWGVDPSPGFYLPMTENQLVAWILHRRDQDILHKGTVPADFAEQHWTDPDWIASNAKDPQLAGALNALDQRLHAGEWKPLGDGESEHAKIAEHELRALERTRQRLTREFARLEKRIDTLESLNAKSKPSEPKDLWADSLDLTGGRIDILDKDGATIARLRVTGRDVERWLENADVEPEPKQGDAPSSSASSTSASSTAPAPTPPATDTPKPHPGLTP